MTHYWLKDVEYATKTECLRELSISEATLERLYQESQIKPSVRLRTAVLHNTHNNTVFRVYCLEDLAQLLRR